MLVVSKEQQASWVRNFNPLINTGGARWPTRGGIYEPLMIYNTARGEWVPWLAEGYRWEDGGRRLVFQLRDGVRWSDGRAFTARDVACTFELLLEHPALDGGGVRDFLAGVDVLDERTVALRFSRPYSPGLALLAQQPIVPEHIWSQIPEPASFANPEPVATGPFTEVLRFTPQLWELGRNPDYWRPEQPAVRALRMPALPTNEQASLALLSGELDWAGNFVPAIDRIYVGEDPQRRGYWFPLVGETVLLYPNHADPRLADARVRRAVSLAIDRELLVEVAMYGYTRPADGTGLSDGYRDWKDPRALEDGGWVGHDPARAAALLDEAGFPADGDGLRRGADGAPLSLTVEVVAGWSDWVRAARVIASDLRAVGIDAGVRTYDFGAWFQRLTHGEFELSIGWSQQGPTPYNFYQGVMSRRGLRPVGEFASSNWHRCDSAEMDELLRAFERTSEPSEQREIAARMQRLFAREAPAIPLFPNPSWGVYSARRFTGWPTASDPYARLSPNHPPETLLVLTALEPREESP